MTTQIMRGLIVGALLGTIGCGKRGETDTAPAEPAGGAVTLWTDSIELFMEHPALIVGTPDKFAVHLTDITDFAPLRSGRITLRFQPRDGGAPVIVVQDTPRAPGIYGPSPAFTRPGLYDLTLLVQSPQARDSLFVPALRVYATAAEAPKDTGGTETGISFLKEQQWKTPGFRTVFAYQGSLSGSIEATGQIVAAGGRQAEVAAPIAGLIDVASVAAAPAPGQRVARGQVLAFINPSLGESGSSYAEARARLREAEDEYERAKRLVAAEAAPARRLHEADIRLQAARETLVGLGGEGGRVAIRSPISGVVTRRAALPGSRVDAGTSLFTVVDPSVVWLTVNVPASAASGVSRNSMATFTTEGSATTYPARRIVSVGSVIDPVSRTLPLIYEVSNPTGAIKVGANARALVRTAGRMDGVVVPTSAILDDNGRAIVFVQVEGERFERREVTVGGREGELTLVRTGVQPGERVVSGAPYQVRLASLSTAVPAHGHEH
jgi:membrane fusion protein, heavy metal efflux system